MGHELAHTILHHGGQDWSNMATALIVQLLLLSVLDSTGVGTLFWELFGTGTIFCTLSFKRFAFLVPSTRACESEADLLGLDLVSKARYNPSRAVDLFQRFKAFERTHGVSSNVRSWDLPINCMFCTAITYLLTPSFSFFLILEFWRFTVIAFGTQTIHQPRSV